MSNTTGIAFRVTTFGESHGPGIGCVIDGCPSGLALDLVALQAELDRRRPGQSRLTTQRDEPDRVEVLSGLYEGLTTGAPLTLFIRNEDADSRSYEKVKNLYRPGHADLTWEAKYGLRDPRGGGRASARETAARVAAGAVARQLLSAEFGIAVIAWVEAVGALSVEIDPASVTLSAVEKSPVRCPDPEAAASFAAHIDQVRRERDTIGGVVGCVARGVPRGLGEPVFDKLDALLAHACLSLPACKGFEIGSGFRGTTMRGSEHNDPYGVLVPEGGDEPRIVPLKNDAGGVLGGLSTGAPIVLRCAFKPVSTHFLPQRTVNREGQVVEFTNSGRHDPCVLPRAVPVVEAAVLLVLMDCALRDGWLQRLAEGSGRAPRRSP